MIRRLLRRSFIGAVAAGTVFALAASPAQAYGPATWQVTFNGTGVQPGFGGFGFWGWCDFAGGLTAGGNADCQFAQYFHSPSGGLTCEDSLDITSWTIGQDGDFLVTGRATIHPANKTEACLSPGFFPNSLTYSNADTQIPALLPSGGHLSLGAALGGVGEFNITETVIH